MARLEGYDPPDDQTRSRVLKKVFRAMKIEISVLRLSQIIRSFRRFLAILAEFSSSFGAMVLQR